MLIPMPKRFGNREEIEKGLSSSGGHKPRYEGLVEIIACLAIEKAISFADRHYLRRNLLFVTPWIAVLMESLSPASLPSPKDLLFKKLCDRVERILG